MKTRLAIIGAAALLLTACAPVAVQGQVPGVVIHPVDPYYYSPAYCAGCWYGEWGGRIGYHRGGGRPWERPHIESDHRGQAAYDNSMRVDPTAPLQPGEGYFNRQTGTFDPVPGAPPLPGAPVNVQSPTRGRDVRHEGHR